MKHKMQNQTINCFGGVDREAVDAARGYKDLLPSSRGLKMVNAQHAMSTLLIEGRPAEFNC
jgi:hypothetical protein